MNKIFQLKLAEKFCKLFQSLKYFSFPWYFHFPSGSFVWSFGSQSDYNDRTREKKQKKQTICLFLWAMEFNLFSPCPSVLFAEVLCSPAVFIEQLCLLKPLGQQGRISYTETLRLMSWPEICKAGSGWDSLCWDHWAWYEGSAIPVMPSVPPGPPHAWCHLPLESPGWTHLSCPLRNIY